MTEKSARIQCLAVAGLLCLTAYAMPDEGQSVRDVGMNEHLPKPVDAKVLAEVLGRYLRLQV